MQKLAIVSPGYPDQPGGVTDHTARVMANWQAAGCDVSIAGRLGIPPESLVTGMRGNGVTGILLQYVPFLYGRRGLSSWPERLATAATAQDVRVTLFVHEPWVPATRLPWLVLSPLQRRQLRRLLAVCDAVVTAVPAWRALIGDDASVVYVGTTLGPAPTASSDDLLSAPVVFSPFAAGLNWRWIRTAAEALGAPKTLTVIGADATEAATHPSLKRWCSPLWDFRGRVPADEALRLLSRARLVLSPFVDGLTGRRTSVFASLSVGARVISSSGPLFDPFFDNSPVAIAGDERAFVEDALRNWDAEETARGRLARRSWYDRRLSPEKLDGALLAIVAGHGEVDA